MREKARREKGRREKGRKEKGRRERGGGISIFFVEGARTLVSCGCLVSEKWQWLTAHRQWVSESASVAPSHPQSRLLKWHTTQLCAHVGVRRGGVHMGMCGGVWG